MTSKKKKSCCLSCPSWRFDCEACFCFLYTFATCGHCSLWEGPKVSHNIINGSCRYGSECLLRCLICTEFLTFSSSLQISHKKIRVSSWCRHSPVLNNNSNSLYIYIIGKKINGSRFSASRMQFRIRENSMKVQYKLKAEAKENWVWNPQKCRWILGMSNGVPHRSLVHTPYHCPIYQFATKIIEEADTHKDRLDLSFFFVFF